MNEGQPKHELEGKGRALPFLLYQMYVRIDTTGEPVTNEQIIEAFKQKYGYEPKSIKRYSAAVLAGPVLEAK